MGPPAAAALRMGHLCPEGTLAHLGAFNKVVWRRLLRRLGAGAWEPK